MTAQPNLQCRICRQSDAGCQIYQVKEMMFGWRDTFDYFECSHCGCLQIREFPNDIAKYYAGDYYSFIRTHPLKRRIKDFFKRHRDSHFFGRDTLISRALAYLYPNPSLELVAVAKPNLDSRILDIGCGASAWILNSLKNLGFKNLLGTDPGLSEDIQEENGLCLLKKSVHELGGTWDLIMFHHSFEHIRDPHETLDSVRRLLSPGGLCLIRIPIVSSHAWRHYRAHWVQLDAPRHFFLHSLKSLELLAAQHGFAIEKICYDSCESQFWGSEQYARDIPLCAGPIFSRRQMRAFRKAAEELNRNKQGDQAAFYLRKQ